MGSNFARTTQAEYYVHNFPSSYNLVLRDALGGSRGKYLYPVAGTLSGRNKFSDISRGEDSHGIKSLAMVSTKPHSVAATKTVRNEGQEEAIREAMAAFMEMDSLKAPKVPNDVRIKKARFRDSVQNREDILENKMNPGADIQEEKYARNECVSMETSVRNGATKVATEVFSVRPQLERDKGKISAQNIIKRAEHLIADSSLNEQRNASTAKNIREKDWLKLLASVQQAQCTETKSDRVQLILQLLDMMYDSGTRVNAMHICTAVTVHFFSCP